MVSFVNLEGVQNFVHFFGGQMTVEFVIQLHHRGDGTGAQAGDLDHGEAAVPGVPVRPQLQAALQMLDEGRALFDVAGRPPADVDDMLSQRGKSELPVESRHPVDPAHRDARGPGDLLHGVGRKIPAFLLHALEKGDEAFQGERSMISDNLFGCAHEFLSPSYKISFPPDVPLFQNAADCRRQLFQVDRLFHLGRCGPIPSQDKLELVHLLLEMLGIPRDDDDGDLLRSFALFQLIGQVKAFRVRVHHDVQDDEVRRTAQDLAHPSVPLWAVSTLYPRPSQEGFGGEDKVLVVVDQENVLSSFVAIFFLLFEFI